MNLNVKIAGQGYPILCLHGHPGSSQTMSVFTDVLARSHLTIAPDLRGYGRSPARGKFMMQDHLDDLLRLLDQYQIEKCLLLGWSLGGILSLELALKQYDRGCDRFSGIILVASAAYPRSNHPKTSILELINTGIAGILNYFKPGWPWTIELLGKRSLLRYLVENQTPAVYSYLGRQGVPAALRTSWAATRALNVELARGYNKLTELEKIKIPCLVLAGECDRHITADSSAQTAQQLPQCDYICYPNTAHLFPWEIPERVNRDIQTWLETQHSCKI